MVRALARGPIQATTSTGSDMRTPLAHVRHAFAATLLLSFSFVSGFSTPLGAQSLSETFESAGTTASGQHGPSGLLAAGWMFRNQSEPQSSGDWVRWAYSFQGSWSLHVDQTVGFWDGSGAEVSSWAILPPIGQAAGDELRFQFATTMAPPLVPTAHLEIRHSPSGGTGTGSGADQVGDFGVLVADLPDPADPSWSEFRVTVPAGGRLALRFHIPSTSSQSSFWGDFHIDNLSVGPAFSGPPIPGPGETVHWDTDLSPIVLEENTTIPAGGTVIVDPGVSVQLGATTRLIVSGALIAAGNPGAEAFFTGGRILVPGELSFTNADVATLIQPESGGVLTLRGVRFHDDGHLTTVAAATYVWSVAAFVDVEDCVFEGAFLILDNCVLRLVRSSVLGTYCSIGHGYLFLDDVGIAGAVGDGLALRELVQPVLLDNLTVTGSAGMGLSLVSLNLQVGGNVVLSDNLYPVGLGGAGILPGSVLPAFGNVNDSVHVESSSAAPLAGSTWADPGIPYDVFDAYFGGHMRILPGVHVRLEPAANMWGDTSRIEARGVPGNPVVFERLNPALPWQGLQYFHRFEGCVIDGGDVGARFHSSSTHGFIDDCVIRNCLFGTQNDVIVRKTRFVDNDTGSWSDNWTGSLTGFTGANSFEGNRIAVDGQGSFIDAQGNWWDDPSGPVSSDNPGGTGQPVEGAGIRTQPHLTAAPDPDDHPPRVHLNRHDSLLEPGTRMLVTWTAEDEEGIVAQRVEFVHPLLGTTVLADDLPASRRAIEWTVPEVGFIVNCAAPQLRVVATDTAGQEGWDASEHLIPSGQAQGTVEILTDLSGPFLAGQEAGTLCWNPIGLDPTGALIGASVRLDADRTGSGLGGVTSYLTCLSGQIDMPFVSTDSARIAISITDGGCNRLKYVFSEPFEIRPDARIGDAPPEVHMLSPLAGQSFAGGSVLPITWSASDDEGLRAFHVQATYDAGRTWHFLVEDLPGSTREYSLRLPPSEGIDDMRVRVIAVDQRFQNSSDGASRPFSIVPGNGRDPGRRANGTAPGSGGTEGL